MSSRGSARHLTAEDASVELESLRPAGPQVPTDDAESVSPKSSTGSDDSLTAQLLLGQRSALFTRGSMSASSSRTTSPPRSPAKGKQATADLLAKPSPVSSSLKASLRKETLASTTPGSGEVEIAQAGDQESETPIPEAHAAQNQDAAMPTAQEMGGHVTSQIVADTIADAVSSPVETNESFSRSNAAEPLVDAGSSSVEPDDSSHRTGVAAPLAEAESSPVEPDDSSFRAGTAEPLADADVSLVDPDDSSTKTGAGREQRATTSTPQQGLQDSSVENSPSQHSNSHGSATPSQEAAPSQGTDRADAQVAQLESAASEHQKSHGHASTSNQQPPVDLGHSEHGNSHNKGSSSNQQQADGQCQNSHREASTSSSNWQQSVSSAHSEDQESHRDTSTSGLHQQQPHERQPDDHGQASKIGIDQQQPEPQTSHAEASTSSSNQFEDSHAEASTSGSNQQHPVFPDFREKASSSSRSQQQPDAQRQETHEQASRSGSNQQQTDGQRRESHGQRQKSHGEASTSGSNLQEPEEHLGPLWRQRRKHVLVLSNAGKPIWTLHGDENALAGLMGVVQALTSFVHDKGDTMQSVRAGKHCIVFLERGPFIFVMASATGEPEAVLLSQLRLIHAQILSILTSSVDKTFAKNPSYDARKLLGSTSHVLTSLVNSFESDPSALLTCLVPLPLKSSLRHSALVFLQSAVKSAGALFGVLLTQKAIVAVAQSRAHMLHPHDVLLLANLVRSNESFKQAQTFTPVCLPHFNPSAFLHAYVQYLHADSNLCLVLLSAKPDSFFLLAEAAQEVERQCKQSGVLQVRLC